MTPNRALEALLAIEKLQGVCADIEADHSNADRVLCELLRGLGYSEIVDAYESIDKWYA